MLIVCEHRNHSRRRTFQITECKRLPQNYAKATIGENPLQVKKPRPFASGAFVCWPSTFYRLVLGPLSSGNA